MSRFEPPRSIEDIPTVADLVAAADEKVAGLVEPKKRLAWILRRHMIAGFRETEMAVPNLLVIGPTGGGKSHLLTTMLKATPVPWTEANATEYSDVGYAGRDLTTMYSGLIGPQWAGIKQQGEETWTQREMLSMAQNYGVVLLDEFDKLRMVNKPGERQVGKALQAELLKLVEGTVVEVRRYEGDRGFTFATHGVLHIAIGAFEGLNRVMADIDEIVNPTKHELLSLHLEVEPYDIQKYGFMEELVGRFSCILPLPHLDHDAMARIVSEQIVPRYQQEFALHEVGFMVEDGALAWIAGEVIRNGKSGARSIHPLMEELTWREAADAKPGQTVAITASSVQERRSELRNPLVAA